MTRFTLTSPEPGQLVAAWTAPQADRADDYRVSWAKQDQDWPSWRDEDRNAHPTTTTHTINGLDHGADYKVRVRARLEQNTSSPWSGPWSEAALTVSAPPADAPETPTGLALTLEYGIPVLTWNDPGDETVTGHRIRRGPGADSLTVLEDNTASASRKYTDDSAQVGQTYHYAVEAINPNGASGVSGAASVTSHAGPYNLLAAVSGESVSLSWTAPDAATATGYRVLSGASADDLSVLVDDTGGTAATYRDDTEREPGTVHYAVAAHVPAGTTRQSAPVSVQIEGTTDTQPADPSNDETVVLVTNAAVSPSASTANVGPVLVAQSFRTGSAPQGYALHTVHLQISTGSGAPSVAAAIHADGNPSYGDKLYDLTGPGDLDAAVDVFTAPEDTTLEPDTTYWLVIRRSSQTGTASLQLADSPAADNRSMAGFTLSSHLTETATGSDSGTTTRSVTRSAKPVTQGATVRVTMNGQDLSDVPASTQSTETLTVGQEHEGRINFYGDTDWYPVELQANRKYAVETGNGTAKHLSLTGVYDSGGTEQTVHRVNAFTRYPTGQRAYFTPASAGTYYVGAGVATYAGDVETHRTQETIDGEVVETVHTRPITTGAYTVSVFDADPETANVSTQASANAGGSYHGELYPPHNSLTDTDWIKVTMEQDSTYLLLLSGYTSTVNFRIVSVRDSSGNPVSGFTGVNSDRDPQGGGFNSWVDATYTATASGDYFVELTAEAANYMKETVTGTDAGGVATAGTQTLATWDFFGAQYQLPGLERQPSRQGRALRPGHDRAARLHRRPRGQRQQVRHGLDQQRRRRRLVLSLDGSRKDLRHPAAGQRAACRSSSAA